MSVKVEDLLLVIMHFMAKYSLLFLTIKPTRCTNFSILFWNETLHVSGSSSVHHQEYFTVDTAMVYFIPVCGQLFANRYEVYHCCVYSEILLMMDRGTVRNM